MSLITINTTANSSGTAGALSWIDSSQSQSTNLPTKGGRRMGGVESSDLFSVGVENEPRRFNRKQFSKTLGSNALPDGSDRILQEISVTDPRLNKPVRSKSSPAASKLFNNSSGMEEIFAPPARIIRTKEKVFQPIHLQRGNQYMPDGTENKPNKVRDQTGGSKGVGEAIHIDDPHRRCPEDRQNMVNFFDPLQNRRTRNNAEGQQIADQHNTSQQQERANALSNGFSATNTRGSFEIGRRLSTRFGEYNNEKPVAPYSTYYPEKQDNDSPVHIDKRIPYATDTSMKTVDVECFTKALHPEHVIERRLERRMGTDWRNRLIDVQSESVLKSKRGEGPVHSILPEKNRSVISHGERKNPIRQHARWKY